MRSLAIPDDRSTPGSLTADTVRADGDELTKFTMVTLWESESAIAAFAGDDIAIAKYYDFDPEFLVEMSPYARHFAQAFDT
jgi:hypothetical protein